MLTQISKLNGYSPSPSSLVGGGEPAEEDEEEGEKKRKKNFVPFFPPSLTSRM